VLRGVGVAGRRADADDDGDGDGEGRPAADPEDAGLLAGLQSRAQADACASEDQEGPPPRGGAPARPGPAGGRWIRNEGEVLALLRALPGVRARPLDLACRPRRDMLAAVAATDLLVAAGGAALAHALFLPEGAAVVAVTAAAGARRQLEHLARLRGLAYFEHVQAGFRDGERSGRAGPPAAVARSIRPVLVRAVAAVRAARRGAAHGDGAESAGARPTRAGAGRAADGGPTGAPARWPFG
jgi:hypothetical protein